MGISVLQNIEMWHVAPAPHGIIDEQRQKSLTAQTRPVHSCEPTDATKRAPFGSSNKCSRCQKFSAYTQKKALVISLAISL
jgi:hypothetical protein